jgi:hypothetical protein
MIFDRDPRFMSDFLLRLGITWIFSMLMVVMVRLLDVDDSDSSSFRC